MNECCVKIMCIFRHRGQDEASQRFICKPAKREGKGQSVSRDGNVTDEIHLEGFSDALCYCGEAVRF